MVLVSKPSTVAIQGQMNPNYEKSAKHFRLQMYVSLCTSLHTLFYFSNGSFLVGWVACGYDIC